jgi:hypothetical protein
LLKTIGCHLIVIIHVCDPLPARLQEGAVYWHASRDAPSLQSVIGVFRASVEVDESNATIAKILQPLFCIVGTAVSYHDYFEILVALVQDRTNGAFKKARSVVRWDSHRYLWPVRHLGGAVTLSG